MGTFFTVSKPQRSLMATLLEPLTDARTISSMATSSPIMNSPMLGRVLGPFTISTCLNIPLAIPNIHKGLYELSQKAQTSFEKFRASLNILQGASRLLAGTAYLPVRAIEITALFTPVAKTTMAAGTVLGNVGNALFGVFALFLGVRTVIDLFNQVKLKKALKGGAEKGLKRLQQELEKGSKKFSPLVQNRELIRNAKAEDAEKIVNEVLKGIDQSIRMDIFIAIACASAVAGTVLLLVATAGVPLLVGTLLFLAGMVGYLILDSRDAIAALRSGKAIEKDKLWFLLISALAITTMIVATVATGGALPIALSLGIGIFWISVNLTGAYVLHKKKLRALSLRSAAEDPRIPLLPER